MLSSLTREIFRAHAERGTRPLSPLDDRNRRMALMTPPWALDFTLAFGRHREIRRRPFTCRTPKIAPRNSTD